MKHSRLVVYGLCAAMLLGVCVGSALGESHDSVYFSLYRDGGSYLYKFENGRVTGLFEGGDNTGSLAGVSPDGQYIAVTRPVIPGDSGKIVDGTYIAQDTLWIARIDGDQWRIPLEAATLHGAYWSPDSRYVLITRQAVIPPMWVGVVYPVIHLYDMVDRSLTPVTDSVPWSALLGWYSDSRSFALWHDDAVLRINFHDGQFQVTTVGTYEQTNIATRMNRDGVLLSRDWNSEQSIVVIWTQTGRIETLKLREDTSTSIYSVAWSGDGNYVVAAFRDGSIVSYRLEGEILTRNACAMKLQPLKPRSRYMYDVYPTQTAPPQFLVVTFRIGQYSVELFDPGSCSRVKIDYRMTSDGL